MTRNYNQQQDHNITVQVLISTGIFKIMQAPEQLHNWRSWCISQCRVKISVSKPFMLTETLSGFPQSFQENTGI